MEPHPFMNVDDFPVLFLELERHCSWSLVVPASRCLVSSPYLRFALTPKALASRSYNGLALPSVVSLFSSLHPPTIPFPDSSKRPGRSPSLSFILFFRVSVTPLFLSFHSGLVPIPHIIQILELFFLFSPFLNIYLLHLSICRSRMFSLALSAWLFWLTLLQSSDDLLSVVPWNDAAAVATKATRAVTKAATPTPVALLMPAATQTMPALQTTLEVVRA
jgi:hypothetical protein